MKTIKVGVLTSSRADFGIYIPLLKKLQSDDSFDLRVIAFGTHVSQLHGFTRNYIINQGFEIEAEITSLLSQDNAESISSSFGITAMKFAEYWRTQKDFFDLVFCLGDRFEMAAAVAAGIPLGINFAHIHGGETTFGAIDNIYRDFISLSSKLHFVATEANFSRLKELLSSANSKDIYVTGALSLDNLVDFKALTVDEFEDRWGFKINAHSILVTVHPETVDYQNNEIFSSQLFQALEILAKKFQIIITMPNADTMGNMYRNGYEELATRFHKQVKIVENFGTEGYFTCMDQVSFLLGNTSSGIIEAASFKKFVINVGNRQKGRQTSDNVIDVPFDSKKIVGGAESISRNYKGSNIYYKQGASDMIIKVLRNEFH